MQCDSIFCMETTLSTKKWCHRLTTFTSQFYWCSNIPYSSIPGYPYTAMVLQLVISVALVPKPYGISWLDHKLCEPCSITIFTALPTKATTRGLTIYRNLKENDMKCACYPANVVRGEPLHANRIFLKSFQVSSVKYLLLCSRTT